MVLTLVDQYQMANPKVELRDKQLLAFQPNHRAL